MSTNKTAETDLSKGVLNNTEWLQDWQEGDHRDISFHQPSVRPQLSQFEAKMFEGKQKSVFVPLCGKTLDLMWFYERGHSVCGVDLAELAVKEFFQEHNLEAEVSDVENVGKLYKSKDGRMKLYVADLFDVTPDVIGQYDVIYDCQSLSALNKEDRVLYVNLMLSILKQGGMCLLYIREYDPTVWPGPPHSMSQMDVNELYGSRCEIEELVKDDLKQKAPSSTMSVAQAAVQKSEYIYALWYAIILK